MSAKLTALKLFLDELGIDSSIDTVDDPKRVQKAVYLGQVAQVDLGYRFGWYLRGLYNPGLIKDYFALADGIGTEEIGFAKQVPQAGVARTLNEDSSSSRSSSRRCRVERRSRRNSGATATY